MPLSPKPITPTCSYANEASSGASSQPALQGEHGLAMVRVAVGSLRVLLLAVDRHIDDRLDKLATWAETNDVVWID